MLTKTDAIKVGKAICDAVRREQENNTGKTVLGTDAPRDNVQSNRVYAARGTGAYAMDNLWYDVLTNKVKEQFNHDRNEFMKACNWPE